MFKRLLIFLGLLSLALFLNVPKVKASDDSEIVINEVMADPIDGTEWIELYNKSDSEINLSDYTIEDGTNKPKSLTSCSIEANDYLLLSKGSGDCHFGFILNNDDEVIILKKSDLFIDQVVYGEWGDEDKSDNAEAPGKGESLARSPDGIDSGNDKDDFIIDTAPTPGEKNHDRPKLSPPQKPKNLLPADGKILNSQSITLNWEVDDSQPLEYEVVVTSEAEKILVDHEEPTDIEKLEYKTSLDWGTYFWQVIAYNADDTSTESEVQKLILEKPIYSKNIIINEISPHPEDGADFEFIELYNKGDGLVDLSGWLLDDAEGGSTPYEIPLETIIGSKEYLGFYKTETKISLNDAGDSAQLFSPDNTIVSTVSYSQSAPTGYSWALSAAGEWGWTDALTPKLANIFHLPEKTLESVEDDEEETVINKTPIKIKTGEHKKHENKLVQISGEVTQTNGRTFYLNDGSGQVKVYIQAKTEIKKPPMHKGDLFGVIGVINLYRGSYRILPREQDDIWLISAVGSPIPKTSSTAKNSLNSSMSPKKAETRLSTNGARAPNLDPLGIKAVEAAEVQKNGGEELSTSRQTFWWINLIKAITFLAVIFMVLLVIKIKTNPRVNIKEIGGHFGRDDT